ncbi:MAG: trypsin-like peptidase domain-containing protein [Eubacteriales bacterium]|nr:trypsin-like peptidase domain-containing protein [Eubacteriales bacterium]
MDSEELNEELDEELNEELSEETYEATSDLENEKTDNPYKGIKKERRSLKYFLSGFAGALLGILIGAGGLYYYFDANFMPLLNNPTGNPREININTTDDIYYAVAVAEKAMDSVVGIVTRSPNRNSLFGSQYSEGMGSGVIVSSDGYILTNSHVIADGVAESVIVKFIDGTEAPGEVLWNNVTLDLAVVKVDKNGLQAAEFGDSDNLVIGEPVIAIGNPLNFELDRTVTNGIISGLNRSITIENNAVMKPLIQTNASINPGNSGGPLLNAQGMVIGINTAKIISAEGLGFSIPINVAKDIVEEVIRDGTFSDVYIGIRGVAIDVYERQLNVSLSVAYGVVVIETLTDSPAQDVGLNSGDVIQKIDGLQLKDMGDLQRALFKYKPGDRATLEIVRNGQMMEIEITFEKKPSGF